MCMDSSCQCRKIHYKCHRIQLDRVIDSIKRHQKKTILFENKYYSTNVQKYEVLKFIRDCDEQNCSGILLSQNTGICTKDNFQIDIQNNNVLIYIHNYIMPF